MDVTNNLKLLSFEANRNVKNKNNNNNKRGRQGFK